MKFNIFFPFCYEMASNEIKNVAQCCSNNFYSRLFRSTFFVKTVSILLLSFTLSLFHTSSPILLQEIYLLVFHMPKKLLEMKMVLDFNIAV